ncbi:hypothetical protein KXX36_004653 [Aspergillus fumigatus]|nr:hypothetical protein KXX36_004653 [Aspergillus fumigatus]
MRRRPLLQLTAITRGFSTSTGKRLASQPAPAREKMPRLNPASQVRNVSYLVPTLHAMFAVADQEGLFLHHSSFATAAGTDTAHEEAVIVGKSLAMIGWDMLTDEGLFQTAKKQWEMAIVE